MVFNRLFAGGLVRVAQLALTVAHDQHGFDSGVVAAHFQFHQVAQVVGLVIEELIHIFHAINAKLVFGDPGKVKVADFVGLQRAME